MTTLVDATTEVAVSNLPAPTLALAHRHIQGFLGDSIDQGEDAHDWENITIAPMARYLYDPGYQHAAVPAYVELRIVGSNDPQDSRGYLIISLTEADFPVTEFSTRGATKTDRVMMAAAGGTIHKFMRYSPGFVVGEDADGKPIATLGTAPLKATGSLSPLRVASLVNYRIEFSTFTV